MKDNLDMEAGGHSVNRIVRLSPPQQKALKRLTDKPQSPAWLGARESTLRSLVKLGLCQSTEEPFKPWSPFRQQVRYFSPNVVITDGSERSGETFGG